jgi:hypothetical protein
MDPARRRLIVWIAVAAVLAVAAAVYPKVKEMARGPLSEESLQPQAVSLLPEGNDPHVISIGVTWTESGWCVGQFQATAIETTTEVRLGTVVSRLYANDMCAGVGTAGNMAWADLRLASPLRGRLVIRSSDGAALPVFAQSAALACRDAIFSKASPTADLSVVSGQVALPTRRALQANTTGEATPSSRLFAKVGLYVAASASFELTVPDGWFGRLTFGWGSPGTRTQDLTVSGCNSTGSANSWLVFAGGFWVGEPACVPLLVKTAGAPDVTVHIGVGAACPGQAPPPPGA